MVTRCAGSANAPHSVSFGMQPMVKVPGWIQIYFWPSFLLTRTSPCLTMTTAAVGAFAGDGVGVGSRVGVGVGSAGGAFATTTGWCAGTGDGTGLWRTAWVAAAPATGRIA